MPFPDPEVSLKTASPGGTDFSKTPENAQSGRAAEVRAAQQKSGPPGTSFCSTEHKNSVSLFLSESGMRCVLFSDDLENFLPCTLKKVSDRYTSSSPLQIRFPDFRSKSMTFAELKATFTLVPILKISEPKTTPVRRKSPTRIFRVVSIPVGMTP